MRNRLVRASLVGWIALAMAVGPERLAHAGAFIFAGNTNGIDVVTHPVGYGGSGGLLNVEVCIAPTSPYAAEMEPALLSAIETWNARIPTTGNLLLGSNNDISSGQVDFESVLLHEIGHCVGLAHANLASESGLSGADRNYTKSTSGADGSYGLDSGADGLRGSSDDLRGDDTNLHWFHIQTNDPFDIAAIVDSSTYSRNLADLPPGDTYAANADRSVSSLLGVPNSEAVMQQGTVGAMTEASC